MPELLTLQTLNAADRPGFVTPLDGIYEHSPWIAERAHAQGPFKSLVHLKQALADVVRNASETEQLGLIRAHPELAGKAMVSKTLTAESTNEQGKAGLTDCTPEATQRRLQRQVWLSLHPGRARPTWPWPFTGRDHRHLRPAFEPPPGFRTCGVPAQHPPHCRDSPERQVRA
jgi:hypothetical protein